MHDPLESDTARCEPRFECVVFGWDKPSTQNRRNYSAGRSLKPVPHAAIVKDLSGRSDGTALTMSLHLASGSFSICFECTQITTIRPERTSH